MKIRNIITAGLIFLLSLTGCNKKSVRQVPMGQWRGELSTAGGTLPFFFELKDSSGIKVALLLNGDEIVKIDEVNINGDSIRLYLPAFNFTIEAKLVDSTLSGTLKLIKAGGVPQILLFNAKQNIPYRFIKNPENKINVSGRWAATFVDDEGSSYPAVGEMEQNGSDLNGTFLTPTGDYRYLEGQVNDSSIYLSTFDGAHAFLFRAALDKSNKLRGDFWSGNKYHESWTAVRDKNAKLPNPDSLTFLKKGFTKLDFTFPDLNGNKVSLSDPKYKDKVVIVTLAGSWCPNCHDEAGFLSPFFDKYHSKGLEIIGLMYENYDDAARAIRQIKKFRDKFNIKYDLLLAGANNKGEASKTLPMLNKVMAFPTTIFIDRKGRVRKINTGFSGPGTGEHYIQLTDRFTDFVQKLLNEK